MKVKTCFHFLQSGKLDAFDSPENEIFVSAHSLIPDEWCVNKRNLNLEIDYIITKWYFHNRDFERGIRKLCRQLDN